MLSGDVAAKTVMLLNMDADGTFKSSYTNFESTENCLGCHGVKKEESDVAHRMDCFQCHENPHK